MAALTSGTRIGTYEVGGLIGEGGMGEVYRARDTKLGREVALKVLPELLAGDPDRLARFRREAQVLATLNHPHIAQIYGFEDSGATHALVMELVEGPTLAEKLKGLGAEGLGLPIGDVLPIARQIAEALEAAHERGIVHRDLKPANIKVKDDGTVKVLDFGLAKAFDSTAGVGSSVSDPTYSPTITTPAMTLRGVILGTAAYMAPEQAKGKAVDKRGDIWAFGVVVYEMLSGRRGFQAEDVSETLAAVLTREVDWAALPQTTPARLRELLGACLVRDPRQRLRDIGDARIAIAKIENGAPDASIAAPVSAAPARARALPWIAVCVLGAALSATVLRWVPWRSAPTPPAVRVNAELGADVSLVTNQGDTAVLSADGQTLAFVAQKAGAPQIYIRRLEQPEARPLAGTDNARGIAFSPDARWISFFADARLKKIATAGGALVTLCDAPDDRGAMWLDDETIVLVPNSGMGVSVQRVAAAGGSPETLVTIGKDEVVRFPHRLPGGKALLLTVGSNTSGYEDARVVVQPLPAGPRKVVLQGGYDARYVPSGHIVYVHEGSLYAVAFDASRMEISGSPTPVLEGVTANATVGSALYSVSDTGSLVYLIGQTTGNLAPLSWMDREGRTRPLRREAVNWSNPSFSPDGRRLALDIFDGKQTDVWVYDWARDTLSRVTFDSSGDSKPVWTADGQRIAFRSAPSGSNLNAVANLYWQRSDGTGEIGRLTTGPNSQLPGSFHPSGKFLAFSDVHSATSFDIMILPIEGDEVSGWKPGTPRVFLNGPFAEQEPMFSPDGRWLAYMSNESGLVEIYVRPFPGPGGKWQVSSGGGAYPMWSRKSELLYTTVNRPQVMVVPYVVEGDSFRAERPRLISNAFPRPRPRQRSVALHPDGDRFAVAVDELATAKNDHIRFVFNFFDELRRVAPVRK